MDGSSYIDIIFFAMVAAFLVLRLRSVLGRRTGNERPPSSDRYTPPQKRDTPDNVVSLPDRSKPPALPPADSPIAQGVADIRAADPSFDADGFARGARGAFEMVLNAFASADRDTLRPLTSGEVFAAMDRAIRDREAQGHTLDATLVGIKSAEIIDARVEDREAQVTMKFVSEQVNVTRDREGQSLDGSSSAVETLTDVWTFARDTRSSDPNWRITATRTP